MNRPWYLPGLLGSTVSGAAIEACGDVELVDLPGFGPATPDETLRTVHDWVHFLSHARDWAGRPCIASSVSAMLVLELVAVRPEAFGDLVLCAPFGLWVDDDQVRDIFAERDIVAGGELCVDNSRLRPFFHAEATASTEAAVEHGISRFRTLRTAASLLWPIPDHGLARRLPSVRNRVTLVWGEDDRVLSSRYANRFAELLPNASIELIPGSGHLVEVDAPERLGAIVAGRA